MLHLHSILRWAVLILLLIAVLQSITGLIKKKEFSTGQSKVALFLMIFAHIQLLLGLSLFFTQGWAVLPFADAMKSPEARFWKVEHITVMIFAIVLITVGRMKTKKPGDDVKRHKKSLIYYGIALLLILSSIPWDTSRLY